MEQIKDFEEAAFSGTKRDGDKMPRLEPMNECGGAALLQMVGGVYFWREVGWMECDLERSDNITEIHFPEIATPPRRSHAVILTLTGYCKTEV